MYDNKNFENDLINSLAWDTALVFIQTFGMDNYSMQGRVTSNIQQQNTGESEDKQLNIYDMASNTVEWNTEKGSTLCVYRGGRQQLKKI